MTALNQAGVKDYDITPDFEKGVLIVRLKEVVE
jgi:hypothetical protein